MTSPRERAAKLVQWLVEYTEMSCSHDTELAEAEDRIAEEIGEALDELREGFLRKPTGRDRPEFRS